MLKEYNEKLIKDLAEKYGANHEALRGKLLEEGYEITKLNECDILETIYLYSTELLYCRRSWDKGIVEYANNEQTKALSKDMSEAQKTHNEILRSVKLMHSDTSEAIEYKAMLLDQMMNNPENAIVFFEAFKESSESLISDFDNLETVEDIEEVMEDSKMKAKLLTQACNSDMLDELMPVTAIEDTDDLMIAVLDIVKGSDGFYSARKVHKALGVQRCFTKWFRGRVTDKDESHHWLIEEVDYIPVAVSNGKDTGRRMHDYRINFKVVTELARTSKVAKANEFIDELVELMCKKIPNDLTFVKLGIWPNTAEVLDECGEKGLFLLHENVA